MTTLVIHRNHPITERQLFSWLGIGNGSLELLTEEHLEHLKFMYSHTKHNPFHMSHVEFVDEFPAPPVSVEPPTITISKEEYEYLLSLKGKQ